MIHLATRIAAALFITGFQAGCGLFIPKATIPIATQTHLGNRTDVASPAPETLMVMMPGIGNSANAFSKKGFIARLHQSHPAIDVITAETHFGYFKERSLTKRLKEDIINPAKQKGYDQIWLMGTSLGGLGSLLYAMENPADVAGAIVIAPYLGDKTLIEEINTADSLSAWAEDYQGTDELARALWIPLIQTYCNQTHNISNANHPALYLATGSSDKFILGQQLLAKCLPTNKVNIIKGKHRWETWETLWKDLFIEHPRLLTP